MSDLGAADEPVRRLRSLQRRLRREKLALERLNPLEEPDRYLDAFARVVDLEAERRALRSVVGGADDDGDGDKEGVGDVAW